MTPDRDDELLQTYLDGALPAEDARALEARLKAEPPLAERLLTLAQDEATSVIFGMPREAIGFAPGGRDRAARRRPTSSRSRSA